MSQSLIIYLSIGAALLAASFFKITFLNKMKPYRKNKYWMGLGKTIDLKIYALICSIIIPLILIIKVEFRKENIVFLIPIFLIAILSNFERRTK